MKNIFIYWLIIVSIAVIVAGIIFALVAPYFIQGIQDIFYHSFTTQSIRSMNTMDRNHINWVYSVLGGSLAGWGIMILSLSLNLLNGNNKRIWDTILFSVITWFVIDTTITVKYMVVPNLILNITILVAIIIPYIGNTKIMKKT